MKLRDKVAMISGAGSGIGREVAKCFATEGAKVIVLDINESGGAETAQQITEQGGTALFRYLDIGDATGWESLVAEVKRDYGRIDILHNNAARAIYGKTALTTTDEEWDSELSITLKGTFLGCRAVLPLMIEQGGGSIINTSSTAGISGVPNFAAYSAAKGGVIQLTKSIAVDFGKQGVRANAICPGVTETPAIAHLLSNEVWRARVEDAVLLNRIGSPSGIAAAALYLASDDAGFVTGSVLVVDGGSTMS